MTVTPEITRVPRPILCSRLDPKSDHHRGNRDAVLVRLDQLDKLLAELYATPKDVVAETKAAISGQ